MPKPSAAELYDFVIKIMGTRGGDGTQDPTGAMGFIRNQEGIYVAKQGGAVKAEAYESIPTRWAENKWDGNVVDANSVVDSRYLVETRRKMGEWTGYHAEMIILSAMLCANAIADLSAENVKSTLRGLGGAVIVANATACHHCGSMMNLLGIDYYGGCGKRSLTGWWNPLNDGRYGKGSWAFDNQDTPGC